MPLCPTAKPALDRAEYHVTIVGETQNARPIQSLSAPLQSPSTPGAGAACEPRVTLRKEGEEVSGIRIECSCGQIIELDCVYPGAGGKP